MPAAGPPEGYSQEGTVAVDPVAIPAALRALWEPDTAHPALADRGPVTRLSLGTIVVVTNPERERQAGDLWRRLTERHPSRVILVVLQPADAELRAAISADCHL
ncbi:MAG: hypothetical protein HUU35_15300, partial [Armatimonadetes bacterium]|nr:hypothetical protein [Armatimonadota bacterium]